MPYNDLAAMEAAIDDQTAAIIVEPIQGEGGVHVPDDDYLPGLRALCDRHDLLLIVDEVWTGCGRTGEWFAYQHAGSPPDIMTLGKAVGCGLPVGVMCADQRIADLFSVESYGGVAARVDARRELHPDGGLRADVRDRRARGPRRARGGPR